MDCDGIIEKFDSLKHYNFEFNLGHSTTSSSTTVLSEEANDFFLYLEEQTSILSTILELIKDFFTIFLLIKKKNSINSTDIISFEEYDVISHIYSLEIYTEILEKKINESNESKYLKNTYDSLLKIIYNDVVTFKSLLITYKSILQLDVISSTSNMILFIRNLEISKKKFVQSNFKIYTFFDYFYVDNYHKYHLVFSTFLDIKQNNFLIESNIFLTYL